MVAIIQGPAVVFFHIQSPSIKGFGTPKKERLKGILLRWGSLADLLRSSLCLENCGLFV